MAQLDDLTQRDAFIRRHIGPSPDEITEMLKELDLPSLDALIDQAVPSGIRTEGPLDLGDPEREDDVLEDLRALASRNETFTSMIGMGYHDTFMPAVILRNVLENPGWYTSYTPYQPEISQGRLEALLNFQTMVADLTGMEIANASLLDEGTAAAEAMAMTHRLSDSDSDTYFVDADTHPQTIAVIETRAHPLGIDVVVGDPAQLPDDVFGALLSYPGTSGTVRDLRPEIAVAHAAGALVTVAADLLALVLLTSPGEMGADVVVGSSQRFGVPLGFGGPHAGYLAGRDEYKRHLPGRLVGVSKDDRGRVAYRLALQTREQHIRREKATSNICTAQVLLAVIASFYAVYHGPDGLRTIAERVHRLAAVLGRGLAAGGVEVIGGPIFDTLIVEAPGGADAILDKARHQRINLRPVDDTRVGISVDETTTAAVIDTLFEVFDVSARVASTDSDPSLPPGYLRTDAVLTHPVFGSYRSETEMLRYLRRLADKDVALDRSMIPLGSCTMKLNATTEMIPITWPEFGGLHPFAPLEQAAGYLELIGTLEEWLAELTGYDAVSLQPNSGAQGEFAGLLAIRGYHHSRGDDQRDVCLIPISAHGTNPASATMAGMRVVAVAADEQGNIDVDDLRQKAAEHADGLAALMITYPSTHGVFESEVREICKIVHEHGGQVYMDGANLNAMLGIAKPGEFGSDVSHLNLHKTFTIPHGGGGPGVGPIGVGAHLAPFLPNHPLVAEAGPETGVGPISAAPWGSAGILPISWAYIRLMGAEGLHRATQVAILSANYVAARLAGHYPVLYTGATGLVAHECIIDVRPFKESAGVTVDDIAKRLVDYGFHAPTMSFPVAGTLMIEPTESESKAELDRFCDAMISIRGEIARLEAGEWDPEDNPLHNSPHPAEDVVADDWDHAYGREVAAYPLPALRANKWWSPVGRIDARYGDRNVVCSCPPMSDYV